MTGGDSANPPELGGSAYLRLVLLGGFVGIPAGLAAALFLAFVHELEHWLWTDLPDALGESAPPWYLILGLPVAGASRSSRPAGTSPSSSRHTRSTPTSSPPDRGYHPLRPRGWPTRPGVPVTSSAGVAGCMVDHDSGTTTT